MYCTKGQIKSPCTAYGSAKTIGIYSGVQNFFGISLEFYMNTVAKPINNIIFKRKFPIFLLVFESRGTFLTTRTFLTIIPSDLSFWHLVKGTFFNNLLALDSIFLASLHRSECRLWIFTTYESSAINRLGCSLYLGKKGC